MNNYKEVFQLAQDKGFPSAFFGTTLNYPEGTWMQQTFKLLQLTLIAKWLRDESLGYVTAYPIGGTFDKPTYKYDCFMKMQGVKTSTLFYPTYEEALLFGIAEALKLI